METSDNTDAQKTAGRPFRASQDDLTVGDHTQMREVLGYLECRAAQRLPATPVRHSAASPDDELGQLSNQKADWPAESEVMATQSGV